MYYVAKRESQPFTQNCQQGTEKTPKALVNLLLVTSLPLLAMLVALHFTPVSHSVSRWVVVSNKRTFEACKLVFTPQPIFF